MPLSDEELVARFLVSRSHEAFAELVERHQSRVRGFLRQLTGDPALADDIAQDTFLRTWRRLHQFSGEGRFIAWLMRLAYREFLQTTRRNNRDRQLLDRVAANVASEDGVQLHRDTADLERFLAVLTPDERAVMILGYAHGMSHGEISDTTGFPLGTVKSHIRRSKLRLRERFRLEEPIDA